MYMSLETQELISTDVYGVVDLAARLNEEGVGELILQKSNQGKVELWWKIGLAPEQALIHFEEDVGSPEWLE